MGSSFHPPPPWFLDFHFYRLIGKSEKGFEKLSLRTAILHVHAYLAKRRPLFTRKVLQIIFRISQLNGTKEIHEIWIWISLLKSTLRTDFSEVKSVFGFRVRLGNPDLDFENRNPDFPIERVRILRLLNLPLNLIKNFLSDSEERIGQKII